jgi:transcriptional regulator with XRE-family HTH domain
MNFGERVRQLRKEHNLTLRELADKVGIDFTYLSKIETGKGVPPSEETIRRLAELLNSDSDELILLADKLPDQFERELLARPEKQVAGLYRSMSGRSYSDQEWQEVLKLLKDSGKPS